MKFAKGLLIGLFGGLLYAFTSFYLLTSFLRDNLVAIALFGFWGFIFAVVYLSLDLLGDKVIPIYKDNHRLRFNVIAGLISGIVTGGCIVINTLSDVLKTTAGGEATQVSKAIILQAMYFSIGFMIIGLTVGLVIGHKQKEK